MSVKWSYALIRRALFLFFLIIVDPLLVLGCSEEEEEQRKTGRPLTTLQTLAVHLRGEVRSTHMLYPENDAIPNALSRTTANIIAFLNAQLFTIHRNASTSKSISIKVAPLELEHTEAKRIVTEEFPSSLTVFDYLARLHSSRFEEVTEHASYARLLEEWRKKFSPNTPYTPFLPGVRLKEGMLVFCLRPQDVPYAREIFSHLYDILKNLRILNNAPLIPSHLGLEKAFIIFENHRENREEVLRRWGAPLLDAIEEFHNEQNVVFKWNIVTRAFIAAREEANIRLHEANTRIEANLSQISQIERTHRFDQEHTFYHIRTTTQPTEKGILEALQLWYIHAQKYYTNRNRNDLESRLEAFRSIILHTSSAIREYYQIDEENQRLVSALAIAQYFSERPSIQFVNPFKVKRELWELHLGYREFKVSSDSLGITSLYIFLNNLLNFTLRQIEELSKSPDRLARKLPPVVLTPEEYQKELVIAYKDEIGLNLGIEAFTHELKCAQKEFDVFGKIIMKKALSQIDTREKRELVLLQRASKTTTFEPEIQRRWVELGQIVFVNELELSDPSVRADYLDLQNNVTGRDYLVQRFKLKHHRAQLKLVHTHIMILIDTEKADDTFREILAGLTTKIQHNEDSLKELETQFAQKSRKYEENMKKLVEEHNAAQNLQKQVRNILTLQDKQISILPASVLEAVLLNTLQKGIEEIQEINIPQEIETIFAAEHARILVALREIIAGLEERKTLVPVAYGRIIQLIQSYLKTVEETAIVPMVVPILEPIPSFLKNAMHYHRTYNRPTKSVIGLIEASLQAQPEEKSMPTSSQSTNNPGKVAARLLQSMSASQLISSRNLVSASSTTNITLSDLAQKLDITIRDFKELPRRIVTEILSKLGVLPAN